MSLDIDAICRTCMDECSTYHQLYDYVDDNYKILEMLDDIVPQIHIKEADSSFSHLVCQACVDKLLTGYKFQQLCLETNKRLHDMLKDKAEGKVAAVEAELEKAFDPLTGVESIKLKEEPDEGEKYECEINPDEINATLNSDDGWVSANGEGEGGEMDGSATDSRYNEKR